MLDGYQITRRQNTVVLIFTAVRSSVINVNLPWLQKFPNMRNMDSDTMYHSGKLDVRLTRRHAAERKADRIAIVNRIVTHSRLLKGSRKLFQFVEIPGFLM